MNKAQLVAAMAEKTGMSKKATEASLKAFTEVVTEKVAVGEKIALVGFATLERKERKSRTGVNPKTGAKITIPAFYSVRMKAGKALKEAVNA